MTAQKTARCKRALERLHRDIANYSRGLYINEKQASIQRDEAERKQFFKTKLHHATLCVAALNAKHIN